MERLTIETIGARGDGIAKHQGQPVYIDGALICEIVDVKIEKGGDGVLRGQLRRIIEKSSDRQNPPCPHCDMCGGCAAQHMDDGFYQKWKEGKVKSLLAAKGIEPKEWLPTSFIPHATRRRVTFAVIKTANKLTIGYHKRRSNIVTHIDKCLLLDPSIEQLKSDIAPHLDQMIAPGRVCDLFIQKCDNGFDVTITGSLEGGKTPNLAVLEAAADIVRNTGVIRLSHRKDARDEPEIMIERAKPVVVFDKLSVNVPPIAFLQPSVAGQGTLVNAVLDYMPHNVRRAVDLFSGCGTFTGAMVSNFDRVDAFEGEGGAVTAVANAGHQQVYKRDLFQDPLTAGELNDYDVIVIDPPRAGAKEQFKHIGDCAVKDVVSVSCNPVTFVRDALMLIEAGYQLKSLKIIDQFIWSDHVELVALFQK